MGTLGSNGNALDRSAYSKSDISYMSSSAGMDLPGKYVKGVLEIILFEQNGTSVWVYTGSENSWVGKLSSLLLSFHNLSKPAGLLH